MTAEAKTFPELSHPPIVEVACGVHYESLPALDGMLIGVYWDTRSSEYPERQLQPAIPDGNTISLGQFPQRGVLVESNGVHVLQIQHDRFFVNWRAAGATYPRFSDHGDAKGLKTRAVGEFERLSAFCEMRLQRRPSPSRVELTKIDLLERGKHWQSRHDIEKLLRIGGLFGAHEGSEKREFASRFVEHLPRGTLAVTINTIASEPGGEPFAVRLESRAMVALESKSIEDAFAYANHQINGAFFNMVAESELGRFGAPQGNSKL